MPIISPIIGEIKLEMKYTKEELVLSCLHMIKTD